MKTMQAIGAAALVVAATVSAVPMEGALPPEGPEGQYEVHEPKPAPEGFWTDERIQEAIRSGAQEAQEGDGPPDQAAEESAGGDSTRSRTPNWTPVQRKVVADATLPASPAAARPDYSPATGQLFFYSPRLGMMDSCSAAVLSSPSGMLVMTAAHCVYSDSGKGGEWHEQFEFVPGYDDGAKPYGGFGVEDIITTKAWTEGSRTILPWVNADYELNGDYAFLKLQPRDDGMTAVGLVGGNGFAVGGDKWFDARVIGYPNELFFDSPEDIEGLWDGNVQKSCTKRTENALVSGGVRWNRLQVPNCRMAYGASGGPWLEGYDASTGLGTVRTVSSTKESPEVATSPVQAPYLGELAEDMYHEAEGRQ